MNFLDHKHIFSNIIVSSFSKISLITTDENKHLQTENFSAHYFNTTPHEHFYNETFQSHYRERFDGIFDENNKKKKKQ